MTFFVVLLFVAVVLGVLEFSWTLIMALINQFKGEDK